jgi:hypothetical protein
VGAKKKKQTKTKEEKEKENVFFWPCEYSSSREKVSPSSLEPNGHGTKIFSWFSMKGLFEKNKNKNPNLEEEPPPF